MSALREGYGRRYAAAAWTAAQPVRAEGRGEGRADGAAARAGVDDGIGRRSVKGMEAGGRV